MNKEQFTAQVLYAEKSLYHIAFSILGNDEDCADAIQSAILHAFEKLHTLRNEAYFRTWITRIVMNECYQLLRSRKVQVPWEEYLENRAEVSKQPDSGVLDAVMELEETYRLPLVLFYVEGFSVKEISGMLKLSPGAVKTRLCRGRNLMKAKLRGGNGYDE